ncbi:MAG TPA: NosD domain-containing protein [Candidatus Lokiarchaeia archaeon]|nr:NosD domain-containing protein [Candidatus Lokiarchaeia archaeon]
MVQSKNSAISNNSFSNVGVAIDLYMGSDGNEINGNAIEGVWAGILIDVCDYNEISANAISGCSFGILLIDRSNYNNVSLNDLQGNRRPYGIAFSSFMSPSQNLIENNQLSITLSIYDFASLILVVIAICAIFLAGMYYRKTHSLLLLFFIMVLLILLIQELCNFLGGILYMVPNDIFGVIYNFSNLGIFLGFLLTAEALEQERVQGLKLTGFGVLTGLYVTLFIFNPLIGDSSFDVFLQLNATRSPAAIENMTLTRDVILNPLGSGDFLLLVFLVLFSFYNFMYIAGLMNAKAPPSLKSPARRFLIDVIIMAFAIIGGEIGPFYSLIYPILSGYLLTIFFCIAFFDALITLGRHPALGYVLPFKVMRLFVMDSTSGITMFSYTWNKSIMAEDLFAGMIQAVNDIMKESVLGGEVKEIKLNNAIILLDRDPTAPIVFGLVVTQKSTYLRHSLERFKEEFLANYSQFFDDPTLVSNFSSARTLVIKHFSLIPDTLDARIQDYLVL